MRLVPVTPDIVRGITIVAVLPVVVIPRATEGIDLEVCDIIDESNIPLVECHPQGRSQGALGSILINNAREIRVRERRNWGVNQKFLIDGEEAREKKCRIDIPLKTHHAFLRQYHDIPQGCQTPHIPKQCHDAIGGGIDVVEGPDVDYPPGPHRKTRPVVIGGDVTAARTVELAGRGGRARVGGGCRYPNVLLVPPLPCPSG
jgi:hypothetical protein